MDVLTYLKERTRMLNSIGRIEAYCDGVTCHLCPFSKIISDMKMDVYCDDLEATYPEIAIEVVENWAKDNPVKE